MYEPRFMAQAIEISRRALSEPGTEPFGAVVVRDGVVIGRGLNHSRAHFDPTSHGEVEAIRDACRNLETVDLAECDLYTSCEPCALCVAAMQIAGIRQLYFAASLDQSVSVLKDIDPSERRAIDVVAVRNEAGAEAFDRQMPAEQHMGKEAKEVIAEWAASRTKKG